MTPSAHPQPVSPRPPQPSWQGLFREPQYVDGPYDRGDDDDALEEPSIITP